MTVVPGLTRGAESNPRRVRRRQGAARSPQRDLYEMPKSHRSTVFHGRLKLPRLHCAQDHPVVNGPRGRHEPDRFDHAHVGDDHLHDTQRVGWHARWREHRHLRANSHRGRHPDVVRAIDPFRRLGACGCHLALLRHARPTVVASGHRRRRVHWGYLGSTRHRRRPVQGVDPAASAADAVPGLASLAGAAGWSVLAGVAEGEPAPSTAGGSGSDPTRVLIAASPERAPSLTTLPSSRISSHPSAAIEDSTGPSGPAVRSSRSSIANQIAAAQTAAAPPTAIHRFPSRRRRTGAGGGGATFRAGSSGRLSCGAA